MASVQPDWSGGTYSIQEENGIIVSARRTVLVTGITVSGGVTFQSEAYAALDAAGFTYYSGTNISENIILWRRGIAPVTENSNTEAVATLEYVARGSVPGRVGEWIPRTSATLSQVETATDIIGAPITVSHTFPDDDVHHPGRTIEQGGTVPQLQPSHELTYSGLQEVPSILQLQEKYEGKTNSTTWNRGGVGKWLCASIKGDPVDIKTGVDTWLVEAVFQYRPLGWAQTAIFFDPATGGQPANMLPGVGFKQVQVQPRIDFNDLIAGQ